MYICVYAGDTGDGHEGRILTLGKSNPLTKKGRDKSNA